MSNMKKHLIISATVATIGITAFAQSDSEWGPFEKTPLRANWYIGADAGVQTIWGNNGLSPLRHNADMQIGKWWNPFFATRIKFEMGRFKTSSSATEFRHRQFTDFAWHADAEFNLSNIFGGYQPERIYNLKAFLGVGAEHSWGSGNASANYQYRHASQPAIFAGIKNTWRLSPSFDMNFEIQGSLLAKEIEGIAYKGWRSHGQLSTMVGIAYKFKPRGFNTVGSADRALYTGRIKQLESELDYCVSQNQQCMDDLEAAQQAIQQAAQAAATAPASTMGAKMPTNCTTGNCGKCETCNACGNYMPEMAIFFDINSATISKRETLQLQLYADAIKAASCPYIVVGYADIQTGSMAYNERLALKRAEAVVNMLVNKYGVSASMLQTQVGDLKEPPFTDTIYNRTAIIKVPEKTNNN